MLFSNLTALSSQVRSPFGFVVPWKLIYYDAYTEREDAKGREKFLKSGAGRRLKLGRFPHSLAASLAALPSMSLIPFAPFLRAQLRHYLTRFPARARDLV